MAFALFGGCGPGRSGPQGFGCFPKEEHAMADAKDKAREKIDAAADKAKEWTDKGVDKAKEMGQKAGDKMQEAGEKIKEKSE
jgi:hypothetical protein